MKAIILPLVLAAMGTGAGVGAGIVLQSEDLPPDEALAADASHPCGQDVAGTSSEAFDEAPPVTPIDRSDTAYAKLANQFVVPVITDDRISAMMVLSLSIAVPEGQQEAVFAVEPRLRDELLQVMFNHANIGGFSGNFTATGNMRTLRTDLLRHARKVVGDNARDVLIVDIVRQDI